MEKNNSNPKVISISIPSHKSGGAPEHELVGNKIDDLLKQYFMGKDLVVRCIGSRDHSNISAEELTDIVVKTGTDRYDEKRVGVGYEGFISKGIKVDFYGEEVTVTEKMNFMPQQIWEMHHSAIGDRGYGVHVDLVLLYDSSRVKMVSNLYDFHETSDGYVFKDPDNKAASLLGIIKIN